MHSGGTWMLWGGYLLSICSFPLFPFRCLCDSLSYHGVPMWDPSALHGICHRAVHTLRASARSCQSLSFAQRWVSLLRPKTPVTKGINIGKCGLVDFPFPVVSDYLGKSCQETMLLFLLWEHVYDWQMSRKSLCVYTVRMRHKVFVFVLRWIFFCL